MALVTVDGHPLPNPSEIERGSFDIADNAERTADGTMVMDIVATKRKITLSYNMIADGDYATIRALKRPGRVFYSVTFPGPGGNETMTAYFGDITDRAWHTIGGVRWWQDVQISLIER